MSINESIFSYSSKDETGQNTLSSVLKKIPRSINCVSIGSVEKVHDKQMVDVSIIYKSENGTAYPLLAQVPLLVLQGGGKYIKFPVAQGDTCLLLFCDKDISEWHYSGIENQMPPSERAHNLNDAIAICGVNYMGATGLGEDNYQGADKDNPIPTIQINGRGNYFVKYDELRNILETFNDNLEKYLKKITVETATFDGKIGTSPASGILSEATVSFEDNLYPNAINFPEDLNLENIKTNSIETAKAKAEEQD